MNSTALRIAACELCHLRGVDPEGKDEIIDYSAITGRIKVLERPKWISVAEEIYKELDRRRNVRQMDLVIKEFELELK